MLSQAKLVELDEAAPLARAGQALTHAYFPTDCLISLLTHRVQPRCFEVGQLGYEGVLGAGSALGVSACAFDAVVIGAGRAWQIDLQRLRALCQASRTLSLLMTRFLYFELSQMGALAACAHFHSLEQRLARFLLMSLDRLRVPDLRMTHEALSLILGVRRASVTLAAGEFQQRGWIQYSRGHMLVLNRAGLLSTVCACYGQDLSTYEQVMQDVDWVKPPRTRR
ncbi:Crp/Fnr family transcriptional regulator [Curvibacter sp. HBC28]|uniref:Crp/Fnr family transcriptional regulator n=1 Tax=Curvibacter microcysteis TaxID=3026419 RepID=A0ABT5MCX3_9BURK|nr:Crp/Fnr family transcriptional regulator [Curvibacter sp. HBC28]